MSQQNHNAGQTDASHGTGYDPPHDFADQVAAFGIDVLMPWMDTHSRVVEENEDYKDGFDHTTGQKEGKR